MLSLTYIRENIHAETYGHFVRLFAPTPDTRDQLFGAIETVPTVQAKADWCFKWFDRATRPFASRLVAFAIVEGVFFCSSFAAIYWFRQRGLLPGLCFSNELIARDENMHMRFACLLYAELRGKLPRADIHAMLDEAVALEKAFFAGACGISHFICPAVVDVSLDALHVPFLGLNASLMNEYIEYVADGLLVCLGMTPYYETPNPVRCLLTGTN